MTFEKNDYIDPFIVKYLHSKLKKEIKIQDYILNLNDNEYFDYLYRLASTLNVNSGKVFLNQKDLNRVPSDFIDKFNSAGINAQLSENTVDIIGGFILKNGNIEENMAIDAVIMSKKDVLEDIISRELFK